MPAPLCRCLAGWTAATAATALALAWLVPVAITPAARLDGFLVRLCAGIAALALAGLWTASGAVVVAAARSTAS